jgi:hypothetical protein
MIHPHTYYKQLIMGKIIVTFELPEVISIISKVLYH